MEISFNRKHQYGIEMYFSPDSDKFSIINLGGEYYIRIRDRNQEWKYPAWKSNKFRTFDEAQIWLSLQDWEKADDDHIEYDDSVFINMAFTALSDRQAVLGAINTNVLIENYSQDCRWVEVEDNICPTLTAAIGTGGNNTSFVLENTSDSNATAFGKSGFANYTENKVSTLKASGGHNGGGSETLIVDNNEYTMTTGSFIVRRLTPLECERLQGFPDNWTASESDSARYKALGNSVALPCVYYIMSGIADVLEPISDS